MENEDYLIIFLFFIIILVFILTFNQISKFGNTLKSCEDDFAIINKCGCVPCSWKIAEEFNKVPCFDINKLNLTNG